MLGHSCRRERRGRLGLPAARSTLAAAETSFIAVD